MVVWLSLSHCAAGSESATVYAPPGSLPPDGSARDAYLFRTALVCGRKVFSSYAVYSTGAYYFPLLEGMSSANFGRVPARTPTENQD